METQASCFYLDVAIFIQNIIFMVKNLHGKYSQAQFSKKNKQTNS